jgi:NADH:ubiquinone oxidoreductase subunit F (NADH-binding)
MTAAAINETADWPTQPGEPTRPAGGDQVGEPTRPAGGDQAATALPRLLPLVPGVAEDLRAHLARHGRPPYRGGPGMLIHAVEQAGLTGRGGGAFPVHRKLAIVAGARGRKVIVANGAESEPASRKDALLLRVAPNLVLDGLQLAAEAIGAREAHLYLHPGVAPQIARVLHERKAARLDRIEVKLAEAPPRFLAGQESALVNRLGGGPAVPSFVPPRVSERGLGGAPTLVQNVETLAHLALIARHGPRWFRALGTAGEPGSMLTTVHTQDGAHVVEAEIGAPLRTIITAGTNRQDYSAVLIGGFHGAWLPAAEAARLTLDNQALEPHGAALGAGVIAALPAGRCGLAESARVARYLAAESAGQCGPCLNGLPRMAAALAELAGAELAGADLAGAELAGAELAGADPAGRGHRGRVRADLERWTGLVTGRGACSHPDGTGRFVRSTLTVFAAEITLHARGQCSATDRSPFLPLPSGMPTTEYDWI